MWKIYAHPRRRCGAAEAPLYLGRRDAVGENGENRRFARIQKEITKLEFP